MARTVRRGQAVPGRHRAGAAAAAPHKLILVDMIVPELGCMPGHQPPWATSWPAPATAQAPTRSSRCRRSAAICSCTRRRARSQYRHAVGHHVRGLGDPADTAQVRPGGRSAVRAGRAGSGCTLARRSPIRATTRAARPRPPDCACSLTCRWPTARGRERVDLAPGVRGAIYRLLIPGMRPNALWAAGGAAARGSVLFTHLTPRSVEVRLDGDLATIAPVFTDVFVPAGTG